MTEHDSWDVASDDEGDPEELQRIAHVRLCNRTSPVIGMAVQNTMNSLNLIEIYKVQYKIVGGYATVFFRLDVAHHVTFMHQSTSGVMVQLVKNNIPLNEPILWAPSRDPWVITYLIAGYFRIERAVYALHYQTDIFCEYCQMRRCMICNGLKLTKQNVHKKMKVRLVPLWDKDDPERAGDTNLNLAKTFYALQQPARLPRPRSRKLYTP